MERSQNSEALFPKISSSSAIADLMKFLQYSIEARDFDEVESILTARENNMKIKIENLKLGKDETNRNEALLKVKEESHTNEVLLKLESSKLEKELQRSKRECGKLKEEISVLNKERRALKERFRRREEKYVNSNEESNEKISRLIEDQRKLGEEKKRMEESCAELKARCLQKTSEKDELIYKLNETMNESKNQNLEKLKLEEKLQRCDREHDKTKKEIIGLMKRAEERYAENYNEYLKKTEEKEKTILHLHKKINELENQKLESDRTAEMYKLEVKSFESIVAQKNGEIEELKRKKSEADQVVEELRCKEEKYEKSFEELNEKLHTSRREHDKSIIRLLEDHRREKKRILELYAKNYDKYLKEKEEKDEMILKIKELENQILEIEQKNEELDELKRKKSEADEVVEELSCKLSEADQNLEEQGQRFETLNARVRLVEHDLANILNVSVNDLHVPRSSEMANIITIDDSDDEPKQQEGSLGISTSKRKKSTNGNENNETFPTSVQKEKRRRELPESFSNDSFLKSISVDVDQPFHGIASTDSDDESITSSRIENIIAS